jgi:hypothetical protein
MEAQLNFQPRQRAHEQPNVASSYPVKSGAPSTSSNCRLMNGQMLHIRDASLSLANLFVVSNHIYPKLAHIRPNLFESVDYKSDVSASNLLSIGRLATISNWSCKVDAGEKSS